MDDTRPEPLDPVVALTQLGGVAARARILELTTRKRLEAAVRRQEIQHVARGTYSLPLWETGNAASRLHGVQSHLSAAARYGWNLKAPGRPHVTVPRGRNVAADRRRGVTLHWADLADDDVEDGATTRIRTVLDCAAAFPFDEALAVADSALREGRVTKEQLVTAAATVRGRPGPRVRRVAVYADHRAQSALESVVRALAIEAGLDVVAQHPIVVDGIELHPDVADPGRRLAIEAESLTFHADQESLERDCLRYNGFAVARWAVLRFTFHQAMSQQNLVRRTMAAFA